MRNHFSLLAAALTLVVSAQAAPPRDLLLTPEAAAPAPAFTHAAPAEWLNSPPLTIESLRGHVVLLDFWTFACWNCYRSFPWLNDLEARLHSRGLRVIGVHTPEFDHERARANIERKIAQ